MIYSEIKYIKELVIKAMNDPIEVVRGKYAKYEQRLNQCNDRLKYINNDSRNK
jgi:hypothetical protein